MKPSTLRPKSPETRIAEITESLEKLGRRKVFMTEAIRLCGDLEPGLKTPFWDHIKDKMQKLVEEVDAVQDNITATDQNLNQVPDRVYFAGMGVKKAAVTVLAVEKFIQSKADFQKNLEKIEEEMHKLARERDGFAGAAKPRK